MTLFSPISERDSSLSDTDSRQPSPKARVSSSLLRNSSPTQNSSKTNDKVNIALNISFDTRQVVKISKEGWKS